jgi:predicted GNAT family acetyltransferase
MPAVSEAASRSETPSPTPHRGISPEQLTWRRATMDDHPFLLQTLIITARDLMRTGWRMNDAAIIRDLHQRCLTMPWQIVLLRGEPVAALSVERKWRCFWVQGIYVLPEHQGQGIGTAILRRVLTDALAAGCGVRLHVMVINTRARHLYEQLGFRVILRFGASYLMSLPADGIPRPPLPRWVRSVLFLP